MQHQQPIIVRRESRGVMGCFCLPPGRLSLPSSLPEGGGWKPARNLAQAGCQPSKLTISAMCGIKDVIAGEIVGTGK
jgi:hypothetical protein